MFHLAALFTALFSLALGALPFVQAQTATTLSFDTTYDNAGLSIDSVACSDGQNGLRTKGYTDLGSLPTFPFVGGSYTISGWNSAQCGACYVITYRDTRINVLAVDVSKTGFTVSQEAMDALTGNQAVALGRVDVTYEEVSPSVCGMPVMN